MSGATKTSDLLVTPEDAVTWLAAAHEKFKGPFRDSDFKKLLMEIPDEPKAGWLPVRVPVWYEATVERTFERQVQLLQHQYGDKFRRWPALNSDPGSLRLLCGEDSHPGQSLRWEMIDLDPIPGRDQAPFTVCRLHSDKSPHAGVLAFIAQNEIYGLGMDGMDKPFLWVPGYEVTTPGYGPWQARANIGRTRLTRSPG